MEIRVWCENGDLVGHVEIKPEGNVYRVTSQREGRKPITGTNPDLEQSKSYARALCEAWKRQVETDYEAEHGEKPVGVMSETGFEIQEVE